VFVEEFGDPFHPARLTPDLHSLQRRAGLPEISLHDLPTAATIALLAGVHSKVASERHGHASTEITLDRYSHVLESMQVAAADAIGRFLRPECGPRTPSPGRGAVVLSSDPADLRALAQHTSNQVTIAAV
jgi:hypothetical protein